MKKWVDLKVDDPIYILKIYRNGGVYEYAETKIEGVQDLGMAISIYYKNTETEEDNKYLSFDLYKNELQNSKVETQYFNYMNFYADKEAVLEDLNKYQIELSSKQEKLNEIFKKIEL